MSFGRLLTACAITGIGAQLGFASNLLPDSTVNVKDGVLEWNYASNGVIVDSGADILPSFTSGPQSIPVNVPAQEIGPNMTFTMFALVAPPAQGATVIVGFDPNAASGIINQKSFLQVFGVNESQIAQDLQTRNVGALMDLSNLFNSHQSLFGNGNTNETLVSFTNGTARGTMQITAAPEPAPFVALGLGVLGFTFRRRKARPNRSCDI